MTATPQQITAVALLVQNAATQLHALSQAIVRPDLDEGAQLPTARNAAKLARDSLDLLLDMMPKAPTARKGSQP